MGMGMGMRWPRAGRGAFTMIELIVTIGIIMILIGLMMPALGNTRDHAIRTRDLASLRADMQLLTQYTSANDENYPIGAHDPVNAARLWYRPLIEDGLIDSWVDLGITNRAQSQSLVALTQTAIINRSAFLPKTETDVYGSPLNSQRASSVQYTSEKGILWQYLVEQRGGPPTEWCCLREAPLAPVATADGAARLTNYQQYLVDPDPIMPLHVGIPVVATWYGLAGRDQIQSE